MHTKSTEYTLALHVSFSIRVSGCNGFVIIRNSSQHTHFLCSSFSEKIKENKKQKKEKGGGFKLGVLIKYSRSSRGLNKVNVLQSVMNSRYKPVGERCVQKKIGLAAPSIPSHIRNAVRRGM